MKNKNTRDVIIIILMMLAFMFCGCGTRCPEATQENVQRWENRKKFTAFHKCWYLKDTSIVCQSVRYSFTH